MKLKILFLSLASAGIIAQPVCASAVKRTARTAPAKTYEVRTVLVAEIALTVAVRAA